MIITVVALLLIIVAVYLTLQYSLFLPPVKGLAVLMYHKVRPGFPDELTITPEKLEEQFSYLSENGYQCIRLKEILDGIITELPRKAFMLTFDDAYLNNLEYMYPILLKYRFHATIMLPVGFLGKANVWDEGIEQIMNIEQLKSMDPAYVSFGLHTFHHINLRNSNHDEIQRDLDDCKTYLLKQNLEYLPVLASPYGAYPREPETKDEFFSLLKKNGIKMHLRIGNKINPWPIKVPYEVKRIDIKGTDSQWHFVTKLKKGRVKLF